MTPLFEDDPTFVPPEDATECEHRGYEYYKVDNEWRRRVKIRIWCDICQAKKQCFHEVWEKSFTEEQILEGYAEHCKAIRELGFPPMTLEEYRESLNYPPNEDGYPPLYKK